MKKYFISTLLTFVLILITQCSFCQQNKQSNISIYNKYPWQGQGGLKFSTGTRFNKQYFVEIGYFKSDIPKEKDLQENVWTIGNQNIYGSLEFSKIGKEVYLAPKIGYEYSLVLFSGRVSWVNYFHLTNKGRDSRLVLEPGISFFGFGNLYFGFSLPVGGVRNEKIGKNNLTFTFNYFDMFRPKYKPPPLKK